MNKKAFTLVELAVVLLVIGILAGLLLRNLGGFTASARDQRRIGDLRNVSTYIATYYARQGQYPPTTTWSGLESELRRAGVLGPGISLPRDPLSPNQDYEYSFCTSTNPTNVGRMTNYILRAVLETTRSQAPQIFQGTATSGDLTSNSLSCGPVNTRCSGAPTSSDYCILF
jgi:prepilin-type N-terminal cleavage/methylation domain-containing protein